MDFAEREKQILEYWKDNRIFEKSIEQRPESKQFIFYDGPPFATGMPHYGHLVAGTMKDVIPRYQTMKGYRVPRRWGWDSHGLPVEYEVEKELKISGKKDIEEKLGIGKFNEACRDIVLRYTADWREIVERTGRWVDMDNYYITMDPDYMESIWWVFKSLYDKGLIYQDYKILPFCPRCSTPLSNFEANMPGSYKDVTDPAITVKFEIHPQSLPTGRQAPFIKEGEKVYLLAWTTTPWTLPSNSGLAVGADIDYVTIKDKSDSNIYILAVDRLRSYYKNADEYDILVKLKGRNLIGLKYEPLFDYFVDKGQDGAFRVVAGDFVSTQEGTGIVHIAPGFGEDDYDLGKKEGLPIINPVDDTGHFDPTITDYAGLYIKKADAKIIMDLQAQGKLVKQEKIVHSYPHCWRCETGLIYKAVSTWFVMVTKIKEQMLKNNEQIHWIPEHLKSGRFGKWLEDARDWAISRNRYWGTPLPVWICPSCKKEKVVGSIEELKPQLVERNTFFFVRHGLAEHNAGDILDSGSDHSHLTSEGKEAIKKLAQELRDKNITRIISSPITRTKETAEILAQELGVSTVDYDERLWEIRTGIFDKGPTAKYHAFFQSLTEKWSKRPRGGETYYDITRRMLAAIRDHNSRQQNERIVVVSHGDPLWLLEAALVKKDNADHLKEVPYLEPGQYHEVAVSEIDLHRPWIDQIEFKCACGGRMKRVTEVLDCWFESGAMPYAQKHYPFDFARSKSQDDFNQYFPAHFIAEGIDQTRGWFYTLLVISTALFDQPAFKNVAVNGLVLAEDGKKMSKRLKNYPDPVDVLNKYGADAFRYYILSSPVVRGDTLWFSEKGVRETMQKNIMLLDNVFKFYQTYTTDLVRDEEPSSAHVLDRWIVTKLHLLIKEVTEQLDNYDLMRASRPIAEFINELSTWYLRRSRERLKSDDKKEAVQALGYVLLKLVRLMAPFTPFLTEELYQKLSKAKESVHLENWPQVGSLIDRDVLEKMNLTRWVVSALLEERKKNNVPVRQVLQDAEISGLKLEDEYLELIKDEVNLKAIKLVAGVEKKVKLNLEITPDLKIEGLIREIIRLANSLRKEQGLTIRDRIRVTIYGASGSLVQQAVDEHQQEIMKGTLADELNYRIEEGADVESKKIEVVKV